MNASTKDVFYNHINTILKLKINNKFIISDKHLQLSINVIQMIFKLLKENEEINTTTIHPFDVDDKQIKSVKVIQLLTTNDIFNKTINELNDIFNSIITFLESRKEMNHVLWDQNFLNDARKSIEYEILQVRFKPKMEKNVTKCTRCSSGNVHFTLKQVRSADEPMTTFFVCLDCDKKWQI